MASSPSSFIDEADAGSFLPRRQPYHLPTRVISPPPSRSNTITREAPRTPPSQHAAYNNPNLLTPPPPHTSSSSPRRTTPGQIYRNHVQQSPSSRWTDEPTVDSSSALEMAVRFPLPPSSAGSPSPRSNRQYLSPHPDDFLPMNISPQLSNTGSPSCNTPQQDVHASPGRTRQSLTRIPSPKPLYLPASNYNDHNPLWERQALPRGSPQLARPMQSYSPSMPQQYTNNRLMPSAMPGPNTDDPFNETKQTSSFSPPNTGDTENTFPPTSPNDSLDNEKGSRKTDKKDKKPKGPTPLFKPSMALLFSLSNRKDKLTILLPAMIFSLAAGVVPPIMTFVLGDAFDKFTTYQKALSYQNALPPALKDMSEANTNLKNGMIKVAIELIVLGVFAVVLTTAALWLWVWHGERVAKRLRYKMYVGVIAKPMAWFDLGMGKRIGESAGTGDEDDSIGGNESSGGLMGRFTREIDDVRMALSAATGKLVTSLCTILAGLIVAFYHSWQLTLVIMAAMPLVIIVTVICEGMVAPLLTAERNTNAAIAARVERVTGSITTVKAFNAEQTEIDQFTPLAKREQKIYNKIVMLWGFRTGSTQFLLLSMFIAGFWFGNYLVINGKSTSGDVTIVFWSTLLSSSNLEVILPILNQLEKAKIAMAALLETAAPSDSIVGDSRPTSNADSMRTAVDKMQITHIIGGLDNDSPPLSPTTPSYIPVQPETKRGRHLRRGNSNKKPIRDIKKIHPSKFSGELALHNVTFHYPSRPAPTPAALKKVTMFLPAKDTTFIVGGSGSGKSTIGSLLLRLYKPENGRIEADEQGIEWLDEHWLRSHLGMVSQGASVIFDGTVHENVALGIVGQIGSKTRRPEDVSRAEVIQACKVALFHDFVRELPDGYDTILSGEKGASLSGGQRQRLALARAYLKDPTVLILDEATSALDTVSRSLVYEAIKKWRYNRTTIIITHDLTPIAADDFVYVMRDGEVVEQGYRRDLENSTKGWFRHLAFHQSTLPEQPSAGPDDDEDEEVIGGPGFMVTPPREIRPNSLHHRLSFSPGMPFQAAREDLGDSYREFQESQRRSRVFLDEQQQRRLSSSPNPSFRIEKSTTATPSFRIENSPSRGGGGSPAMQMTRSHSAQRVMRPLSFAGSRTSSYYGTPTADPTSKRLSYNMSGLEKSPTASPARRPLPSHVRSEGARDSWYPLKEVKTAEEGKDVNIEVEPEVAVAPPLLPSLLKILGIMIPAVPSKLALIIGLILCVGLGVCTPMFSSQFSVLLAALSAPGSVNMTKSGAILLGIAAANGLTSWGRYTILQRVGMSWTLRTQLTAYRNVILQDKSWYDSAQNTSTSIMTALVKDVEDARQIFGNIVGNLLVVVTMMVMGITWALVSGWQLTLVGLAMGPMFALLTFVSSRFQSRYEVANRAQREECARRFFTSVSNVKAIRSMSLEPVLEAKFEKCVSEAYRGGKRAAFLTGFGAGVAFFAVYLAQAIMFLVGALFIINGLYTFPQVMQVFTLLIFSISFAMSTLSGLPGITKAKLATFDLLRIHRLSTETAESQGRMTFPISGRIVFDNVSFTYPARPDVPVLDGVSFEIQPNECVGIVGPSGSGKSTVAALLQRLYDPQSGMIRMDGRPTTRIDVNFLRDHVAIVSQVPALFDMSVADNITYGQSNATYDQVVEAAQAANIHDFIMSLPDGYKTHLGESASLFSGGQIQRLQIARALLRPREILLGDEITSALDTENQEAVMKTIMDVKKGRTTVLITHTLETMQMCDRLIVMEHGRVVQQGTFQELQKDTMGMFASLARVGEWNL